MGTEDVTKVTGGPPVSLSSAAKSAGQAAAAVAVDALATAAVNAAKPGSSSTEFKITVGTIALSALMAGLKVFAFLPGPWMLPAGLVLGAVTAASTAYTFSRGSVKKAALAGAAAVAVAAVRTIQPPPPPDEGSQTGSA